MQALAFPQAALCGYDWGGRAACIVAALWPERVRCLVTGDGYNVQDIPRSAQPLAPETEHRLWYQYYFHSARGVEGLTPNRRELCQLLWRLWSPTWKRGTALYPLSAPSFDNPDVPRSAQPLAPGNGHRVVDQNYCHSARGGEGRTQNRRELGHLLCRLWSPTWKRGTALYPLSAPSFDNPDFVEVVIHAYRHRFMYAPGDPTLEWMEERLTAQPAISVNQKSVV